MLDFGRIELEDLVSRHVDKQESLVHRSRKRIVFFVRLVEIPLADRMVVHAQQGLLGGFPIERFLRRGPARERHERANSGRGMAEPKSAPTVMRIRRIEGRYCDACG